MTPNFDEILLELSYRVDGGIPDLTKESHVNHLIDILRENGVSDSAHLAQKARVYFSYLNEAESQRVAPPKGKTWVKNKKTGNIYAVGTVDSKIHDIPKPDEVASAKKSGTLSKEEPPTQGKKLGGSDYQLDIEKDDDSNSADLSTQNEKSDKIKEISANSRKTFYKKGYHKSESTDDAGSAPGNAGSMLNENGSNDVCEFAMENDGINLGQAVVHLYNNLKGGELLDSTDARGINPSNDKTKTTTATDVSVKECNDLREAHPELKKLNNAQLSRIILAASSGLIKAKMQFEGIKKNGWKAEDCTVSTFFGDAGGKSQQIEMARNANRIVTVTGDIIPKSEAIRLISIGGAGDNPSDTAQFTYNSKNGDLMMKFTSDKDSFSAIVAQSSFQKEGEIKKSHIDEMVKLKQIKPNDAEKLKLVIEQETKTLNKIESELKATSSAPARKVASYPISKVSNLLQNLSAGANPSAYYDFIVSKYTKAPFNAKNPNEAVSKFLEMAQMTEEEIVEKQSTMGKRFAFTNKEVGVVARLVSQLGISSEDTATEINNIRKRSIAVERRMLDKMNQIKIKIGNKKVGLGDYMDAQNFIEKFHMAGAFGDTHGVFAHKGLFDVVCGKGVINDDIIRGCTGTKTQDEFIQKFGSEKEEFQLNKENAITGSIRIAYFLNDQGKKVKLGEKRQRSKQGTTGRFNTVYKWDADTINCFKRKNGLATKEKK